jgi:cobalamin synthase
VAFEADPTGAPQGSHPRFPGVADVEVALGLLTPASPQHAEIRSPVFGRAAPLFPFVGAAIGAVLLAIDGLLAPYLPSLAVGAVLLAIWAYCDRGHLDAIEPPPTEATLALLITKGLAILLLEERAPALLFSPILGAWAIVVLAVGSRDAANPARKLAPAVLFNEFAIASLLTLAAVFSLAQGLGIFLGVIAAASTVALRVLLHQRIGGMTGRWLVIGRQLIETITLWVLVVLQRSIGSV